MGRTTGTRETRTVIAIIGDGYVEKYYFEDMKDSEEREDKWFQILPRLPENSGDFDKAINSAINYVENGVDIAFAIVDMDVIFSNNKVDEFKEKCAEVNEINRNNNGEVILCYCNPCFEYWLLLHFNYTIGPFNNCNDVFVQLSNEINDYRKSKNYHSRAELFKKLYPKLNTAINNSERTKEAYDNQHRNNHAVSTIHKLFHKLRIGVDYN